MEDSKRRASRPKIDVVITALSPTAARGINPAQGRTRRAVLLPGCMAMKRFMPSTWRLARGKQVAGRG